MHTPSVSREKSALTSRIDLHLMSAAAVAATGAIVGSASQANATVIYSGPQNVSIPTNDFFGKYIDLETNTVGSADFANADINLFSNTYDLYSDGYTLVYKYLRAFTPTSGTRAGAGVVVDDTANGSSVSKLALGAPIGPASQTSAGNNLALAITYFGYGYGPYGNWTSGGDGYVGLKFTKNGTGATLYGWLHVNVTVTGSGDYAANVIDWAYDDSGASVQAGVVPEPTSLGLLAAGALGMIGRRRQKATAQLA